MDGVEVTREIGPSYATIRDRFSSPDAARKYPAQYGRSRRHRRERRAILHALEFVPKGSWVLDLPCGSGRGTQLLLENGYRVTAADVSPHMVEIAERNCQRLFADAPLRPPVMFELRDVMATAFPTGQFDAVFCNRLLHHFREPDSRRTALRELARVSRGPVIVSFFDIWALDTLGSWFRRYVWGPSRRERLSRRGISMRTFAADIEAAGLRVEARIPTRPGISRQCYVVCRKR